MGLSCLVLFGAVTLIVVLAGGDPADGSTAALERAARTALGDRATVTTQPADASTDEPRPSATTLVGTVAWATDRRSVMLRTSDGERTTEREIRFDAGDAASERGRTVGFALASMVPDEPAPPPPPPPPTSPVAPILRRPEAAGSPTVIRRPSVGRFSFELLGQGAVGIGGTAGGGGGAIAGRVLLGRGFSARLGGEVRLGVVASAEATSRVIAPSIGAAWQAPLTDALRLGARIDALVFNEFISHFDADDPRPDGHGRWLPGADARLEGTFRIVDSTAFLFAVGPELAFGTTHIVVAGIETNNVPPLRICGEVGVNVGF